MVARGHALAGSVDRALERYRELIEQRFGDRLRELVVFGSHARGEATEESDVDVLVVVAGLTIEERRSILDLAYDAATADQDGWCALAPLVYSAEQAAELRARERLLFRDIDREGMRL